MTSSTCSFLSIHFPHPDESDLTQDDFSSLPSKISYRNDCTRSVRALSVNKVSSVSNGFVYIPDLSRSSPQCFNDSSAYIPSNLAETTELLEDVQFDLDLVGVAPWISPECSLDYLTAAREQKTGAMVFFIPGSGSEQPPTVSDPVWDVDDGGRWKRETEFPVYALSGDAGSTLVNELSAYVGDLDDVPLSDVVRQDYGPGYVKIFAQLQTGLTAEMPDIWVFVLIVLGVIGFVVACTSAFMHFLQYKRRRRLRRRIASGEADLEMLGISRITVPQEMLDKIPTHIYICGEEDADRSESNTDRKGFSQPSIDSDLDDEKLTVSSPVGSNSFLSLPRDGTAHPSTTTYSQPTCAICLDDFEPNSTTIRELPCSHIFHPDCVDSFLRDISSLCPLCKKSVLPSGYCPTRVTNAMVRRERRARRAARRSESSRPSSTVSYESAPVEMSIQPDQQRRLHSLNIRTRLSTIPPIASRLSQFNVAHQRTSTPATQVNGSLQNALPGQGPSRVVARSPAAGTPNRQDWMRERARALLGRRVFDNDSEEGEGQRAIPQWRKVLGAVFPGFT